MRWVRREVEVCWFPGAGPVTVGAWELDGAGWWLRRRTGISDCRRWCRSCQYQFRPPYRWWHLYTVGPECWLKPPADYFYYFYGSPEREAGQKGYYGQCTHQHYLKTAMKITEKLLDETILRSLAGLCDGF